VVGLHGVEGAMVNLDTGERQSTRRCLEDLLQTLTPIAARLGCEPGLQRAAALVQANGAIAQRQAGRRGGAEAVARRLAECFLDPWPG
jgi:gamma-glutamyl:cysteine ligase YbdK (ATP-grasp superfamily)